MKKVIKLTESDLMNIVKRVIEEQSSSLESKLIKKGFEKIKNDTLVKKISGAGDFYIYLKNNKGLITIENPSDEVISKFNLQPSKKVSLGVKPDIEIDRISDYIVKSFGNMDKTKLSKPIKPVVNSPFPMDEERFDFGSMSDEELHSLHPDVKKHPRHFKNFEPKGEFLGWRGEVSKRNIYKKGGKFHDAFDKNKED